MQFIQRLNIMQNIVSICNVCWKICHLFIFYHRYIWVKLITHPTLVSSTCNFKLFNVWSSWEPFSLSTTHHLHSCTWTHDLIFPLYLRVPHNLQGIYTFLWPTLISWLSKRRHFLFTNVTSVVRVYCFWYTVSKGILGLICSRQVRSWV
jgi:hypothetical protein